MAADAQREVESKFDVAPDFVMPDLSGLAKKGDRIVESTVALASTYFDTDDLGLSRSRLTLRRRTGEADTGWHLKVPGAGFRTELRWPLTDDDSIPEELFELIAPLLGTPASVAPVMLVRMARTRRQLRDADDALRVEVADDQVWAEGLAAPARATRWREVEVELGPMGRRRDLERIAPVLIAAGAVVSTSGSKLGRALHGDEAPAAVVTAGAIINGYLQQQFDAIVAGHFELSMRLSNPRPTDTASTEPDEAVHQMRVGIRRLRSALATFGKVYQPEPAAALSAELRWLASQLGRVRDCEVLTAKLAAAVDELPGYLIVGPITERIEQLMGEELLAAEEAVRRTFASERYRRLLRELANWRAHPPLTDRATQPANVLSKEFDAARRTLDTVIADICRNHAEGMDLHKARRVAKRIRYAADALAEPIGRPAFALAKKATGVQTALGEYCDAVNATDALRQMADQATRLGDPTFTYGVLVGDERRTAAEAIRDVGALVD